MPEWWTYGLSDFLMFSPRTWYRLVERYNAAVWPGHLVALGLGLVAAAAAVRPAPGRGRLAAGILALAWAWVGWAFLLDRYAEINWAARWLAGLFAAEALLLAWLAVMRKPDFAAPGGVGGAAGSILMVLGLAVYPALAPLLGRGWASAEVFGIMPEPTAVATAGLLLAAGAPGRAVLLAIPVLWLVIAGLTLLALGSPESRVVALCLALVLAGWGWSRRGPTLARGRFVR